MRIMIVLSFITLDGEKSGQLQLELKEKIKWKR